MNREQLQEIKNTVKRVKLAEKMNKAKQSKNNARIETFIVFRRIINIEIHKVKAKNREEALALDFPAHTLVYQEQEKIDCQADTLDNYLNRRIL